MSTRAIDRYHRSFARSSARFISMHRKVKIIAIAGCTNGGKTFLVKKLIDEASEQTTTARMLAIFSLPLDRRSSSFESLHKTIFSKVC